MYAGVQPKHSLTQTDHATCRRVKAGTTNTRNDPNTPTPGGGYAQVFEEHTSGGGGGGGGGLQRSYVLGDDVLSQSNHQPLTTTHHLLYDGHGSTRALTDTAATPTIAESDNFDAYGNALGFDPTAAATSLLYAGEYLASAANQYYLRARHYDTANGRFNRLDPFAGNNEDPQSLHKYAYVHSDPVNGIDPSGEFLLQTILITAFIIGILVASLIPILLASRNPSFQYGYGTLIPVSYARLESHYHSIVIQNPSRGPDEIFNRLKELSTLDMGPVIASNDIGGIGSVVTFDMRSLFIDIGQGDFEVEVIKNNPQQRFFAVRTRAGHPLAGWRAWRVESLSGNRIRIETFSVEHPVTFIDSAKLYKLGGLEEMYATWTAMLNDIASFSGGGIIHDESVLSGERRYDINTYYDQVAY